MMYIVLLQLCCWRRPRAGPWCGGCSWWGTAWGRTWWASWPSRCRSWGWAGWPGSPPSTPPGPSSGPRWASPLASCAPTAVLAQEARGRVDRSDADLVQVIHSDAGGLGLEVRQSLRLELQTNHRLANFSQSLIWPFPGWLESAYYRA